MPPPPQTVPVLVARHDLGAGVVLGHADVRTATYAPGSQPEGLAEDVLGRTLAAPLRAGEPITDVRLVAPALAAGYPGQVAVPVRVPDPGAVGLLAAGDRIDVYTTAPRAREARLVVPGVSVIAVPAAAAPAETGALTGRIVVLGVPPDAVAALVHASVGEFLSFAFSR
jgi:Flp pilus assembly protein CpaB